MITRDELPEEYKEIWDNTLMPVDTNISFDDVILSEENRNKYKQVIKEQQYADKFKEYGLEPVNRLFLYGASGTGKTFSLKALANEIGYTMLYVDISKALSEGNIAKNVSDIFKLANYIGHCIIFFDECDVIAMSRDRDSADTGDTRKALNNIFQQLDQMNVNNIFCCATNLEHRIDAAFERRMNMKMFFRKPNMDIDDCVKKFIFTKFIINDDADESVKDIIKKKASQNAKLSYYEIEEIVKREMKNAILNDSNIVNTSDIYRSLATSMNVKLRAGTSSDNDKEFNKVTKLYDNTSIMDEIKDEVIV